MSKALFHAIQDGDGDKVSALLLQDLDLNAVDRGTTPLQMAIMMNQIEIVRKLLEDPRTNPNGMGPGGYPPLIIAMVNEQVPIFEMLLEHKDIDVNAQMGKGMRPLVVSVERYNYPMFTALLRHPGIDVNAQDDNGRTVTFYAINKGKTKMLKKLLQHPQFNPNIQDAEGVTAIHYAVEKQHLPFVDLILSHKDTDPNIEDTRGDSPLLRATYNGDLQILETLLMDNRTKMIDNPQDVFSLCESQECQDLIVKYSYAKKKEARTALLEIISKYTEPKLDVNVWNLILQNLLRQEICSQLSDFNTMELLMLAQDLFVPFEVLEDWAETKSQEEICTLVSDLLSIGGKYSEKGMAFLQRRTAARETVALMTTFINQLQGLGISVKDEDGHDKSLNQILEDLQTLMTFQRDEMETLKREGGVPKSIQHLLEKIDLMKGARPL
jgi:ankyrin repeat protein